MLNVSYLYSCRPSFFSLFIHNEYDNESPTKPFVYSFNGCRLNQSLSNSYLLTTERCDYQNLNIKCSFSLLCLTKAFPFTWRMTLPHPQSYSHTYTFLTGVWPLTHIHPYNKPLLRTRKCHIFSLCWSTKKCVLKGFAEYEHWYLDNFFKFLQHVDST